MMAAVKKPDWLIKNIIERGSMNLLFGESGAGKSLFALDWAFCIGNGINWHNHKVKQAAQVIYIAGEGHRGLTLRMKALSQKYNEQPENIFFSQRSVNLLDEAEALAITKIVDDMSINPSIIFIDTLHRNMIGDENKSDDMAKFLKCIELLISKTGCAVMLVHHSGHGDKTRARGSSAIKAAMDAEFCVSKEGMTSIMTCTKSKDFDAGQDIRFGILPVELEGDLYYDDDEQKQITSVYLEYIGSAEKEFELKGNDKIVLDSIETAVKEHGESGKGKTILGENETVVSLDLIKAYVFETINDKNRWRKMEAALKSLVKQGLIMQDGNYVWITSL
jgi:archaellum biogenesis ATPase FlaH